MKNNILFLSFHCYFLLFALLPLAFALLLCVCVNVLNVFYLFTSFNDYNLSTGSTFFHIHTNIDKETNCLHKNNNTSSKNLWLLFSALVPFLHEPIKNPNHQEAIGSCSRYELVTSDFINACEDIQSLITQLTIDNCSISKLKYQNLNSLSHLLLLLLCDICSNPGPVHQDTLQCSNEWNVFKNRCLYILLILTSIVCYSKWKNFFISLNLLMLPS